MTGIMKKKGPCGLGIFVLGTRGFPNIQGGVEKHCEQLYPGIVKSGANVTVLARSCYVTEHKRLAEWNGVNFVYLWCPARKSLETIIHSFISSLFCIAKRPDIVHFHNMGAGLFVPLVKLFGIKTVLTYHSINYKHQKWGRLARFVLMAGEYLSLKFADKVIVVSETAKRYLENKFKRKDLALILNGTMPVSEVVSNGVLKKYDLQAKNYVFAVSRFVPEKGLHDIVEAYNNVDNPEFKLVIAGDADHETQYSKNIKTQAQKNEKIVLTGFISGDLLHELYANAALFILSSYHEGLPIVLLEAMSHNLPILASNISQNRRVSLPKFRYFTTGNINMLAEKMVELFKKGISEEEKKQQNQILKERYNWEQIVQETFSVYQSVVNHD